MSAQPEVLKQSELLNRLVLERHTAEEVGRVSQLLLDPQSHRLAGLTCKSGFLGGEKKTFSWAQVETIGTDSILLKRSSEETLPETSQPLDSLIGHEVWTDAGNKVGKLVDYLLNSKTGAVINYLFSCSGWRGVMEGIYLLPPAAISSIGRKRIIVLETEVENSQKYAEGLHKRINKAAEFLQEDLKKTQEHMEEARQGFQKATEQFKDKAKAAGEQVQEQVSEVKTQLQDNSQATSDEEETSKEKSDSESTPSSDHKS